MESNEGLNTLFLFATEGILVANENGEITSINPSAEKLFGYDPGELPGKPVETLIPEKTAQRHVQHRKKYVEHPMARSMGAGRELYGLKKDGSEFPVEISLSPYTTPRGKFVIAFIVDITVRKQAEENLKNYSIDLETQVRNRTLILEEAIRELEKTKKDLKNALDKEKELNELKSRFVSMASHEFRTPLTTMLSSLSLVAKYGEQYDLENQTRHIHKIKNSINDLAEILNDFLSVSKLEEGKIENVPEPLNLKTLITDLLDEMKPLAREGQTFNFRFEGAEEVVLDKKIMRHILLNLISNALKFSPENKPIDITATTKNQQTKICIRDYGIGIPDTDQKHLFERFFRAKNATHIQGTGLGLSIVARYVELINGCITTASKENEGTIFTILIQH